jgi:hypothetical protein
MKTRSCPLPTMIRSIPIALLRTATRCALLAVLPSLAVAQAPEILHFTFDAGDATNSAVPGVGNGTPSAGVGFVASTACPGGGALAASALDTTCNIDTGWQVDLGTGDWSVGMHLDLSQTSFTLASYLFGSSTTTAFRCFVGGVAGQTGILLRGGGLTDAQINGLVHANGPFHVAWVYDSTVPEMRGYLDGVQTLTVAQPAGLNIMGTAADFQVLDYTVAAPTGTVMDDFRFYRRAITAAEVMTWATSCTGGSLGTTYCSPAVANSTGGPGEFELTGSAVIANNDLTLVASSLPMNSATLFLTSRTQGAVVNPGGSMGILCLGGSIGRYTGPGQVQNSGVAGRSSLLIDLMNHPTPLGLVQVQPGETWNFQAWYRDAVGGVPTSNFTSAAEITF